MRPAESKQQKDMTTPTTPRYVGDWLLPGGDDGEAYVTGQLQWDVAPPPYKLGYRSALHLEPLVGEPVKLRLEPRVVRPRCVPKSAKVRVPGTEDKDEEEDEHVVQEWSGQAPGRRWRVYVTHFSHSVIAGHYKCFVTNTTGTFRLSRVSAPKSEQDKTDKEEEEEHNDGGGCVVQ